VEREHLIRVSLEKIFDQDGRLFDIKIVNPKAHGIGYLYPPRDNPKNWKKDAPLWVYEMWDYIARGFLGLERAALMGVIAADDALLCLHLECAQDAWQVG